MKNPFATVTLFAAFVLPASSLAQNRGFEIGAEMGAGAVKLAGIHYNVTRAKNTLGANMGLTAQYNFSRLFSLRTHLSYEVKGSKNEVQQVDHEGRSLGTMYQFTRLNYFTLPLLARFTFGDKIRVFVQAGPYAGYLINQLVMLNNTDVYRNVVPYKTTDFGISSGVGVSLPLNEKLALSLEARSSFGLTSIWNENLRYFISGSGPAQTRSHLGVVGFSYRLK